MSNPTPLLYDKTADGVVESLQGELAKTGWRSGQVTGTPAAGAAMVRLFGRLADLIIARLNQVPENHFRAFLETAGVDLLPPRPARTEITFFPAKDAPAVIRVPAGTQVAARKSESRPEVVFETDRDLNVIRAELEVCLVVDPLRLSDRSAQARGEESGSFAAFQGETERDRILYLGDDALFAFPDEASRAHGIITLEVTLATVGRPELDGWSLNWLYFDGSDWQGLDGDVVDDLTGGLAADGRIILSNLPPLTKCPLDKKSGAWLACRLSGGTARGHMPVIGNIRGRREINIPSTPGKPADALFSAIHAGAAFLPLDPGGEFFPLGQRPGRLDAFHVKAQEAFAKPGALVTLTMDLVGLTDQDLTKLLTAPTVEWSYAGTDGWQVLGTSTPQGVTGSVLEFADGTRAFTKGGVGVAVSFRIPAQGDRTHPAWAETKVGGAAGLWLRARVTSGGYELQPAVVEKVWSEPVVHPPSARNLKVSYGQFTDSSSTLQPLAELFSLVDHCLSRHSNVAFSPFSGSCDVPALYLGFGTGFPPNEWLQLLLDVDEERLGDRELPLLLWEYWSAETDGWQLLPASDESNGLRCRGYLGFNAPLDQGQSVQFGRELYWLRARPHLEPPVARGPKDSVVVLDQEDSARVLLDASGSVASDDQGIVRYIWRLSPFALAAGSDQVISTFGDEAQVQLDASGAGREEGREIARYRWRLVSSSQLIARAGADLVVAATGAETSVLLDASASRHASGGTLSRYIWRRQLPAIAEPPVTPYLKGIRCNTVPALNSMSIFGETLGSGNGRGGQSFPLQRSPVLAQPKVYVRETDQLPPAELADLRRELESSGDGADPGLFPLVSQGEQGVWVRWRPVTHFYASSGSSRHYILDPIGGRIIFGDGKRGSIPPLARDNIMAFQYRAHQGAVGNVASGAVTVLRNPSGPLTAVKRVANLEGAAGGGDAETVDQVRIRGPKTIKHRGKAITHEDFAWLARDASGEVAGAWCLPTRDPDGQLREGWVTVVIIPGSSENRPYPRPALLRLVREYLESRALANLRHEGQVIVKGPAYVEARVSASIVPIQAEKGDEVKLQVRERLNEFFHPLLGGPKRNGWDLGRHVYLSEVYAELEAVPGVDHVAGLVLDGSLQQLTVEVIPRGTVTHGAAAGSLVGTFDERLRLVLSDPLLPSGSQGPLGLTLTGFKVGEQVRLVDGRNRLVLDSITISDMTIEGDMVVLQLPLAMTENLPPADSLALLAVDERVRLPLVAWEGGDGEETMARVMTLTAGTDTLCLVSGMQRYPEFEFMEVSSVARRQDRIVIPAGHLVYAGPHDIEMVLEN